MALQKNSVTINFSNGLNTKSDPFQLPVGQFLELVNSVFGKTGGMVKRNGFGFLPSLPDSTNTFLTTYSDNLTAIGTSLYAFSDAEDTWRNFGAYPSVNLSTQALVRNNFNQSYVDTAFSNTGLVCTVFTEQVPVGSTTIKNVQKYTVLDANTGQALLRTREITSTFGTVTNAAKVFSLGNYFVMLFPSSNGAVDHLQYSAIPFSNVSTISSATDISTSFNSSTRGSFDGVVANDSLYMSWTGASGSGIKSSYINRYFTQGPEVTYSGLTANIMSVTADTTGGTPVVWSTFYEQTSSSGYTFARDQNLSSIGSAVVFTNSQSGLVQNISTTALFNKNNIYYEVANVYSYGTVTSTNLIKNVTASLTSGISSTTIVQRSTGLASKGFLIGTSSYFLTSYSSLYQPSYFLVKTNINSSASIVSRLAYSNGGGYLSTGLPSVTVQGSSASVGYLIKDLVQAVNKDTNPGSGVNINGVFTQTGVNFAKFNFNTDLLSTSETAETLQLNGGFLWSYDGTTLAEQNFFLWPDNVVATVGSGSGTSGSLSSQLYNYSVLYRWTDNQGNINRSAPSIPLAITVSGFTGSSASINLNIPTLRLTYKTRNPVVIEVYRWSQAQQTFYQTTSITNPLVNDPSVDSVNFIDRNSDPLILGNEILYTTGGVVENTGAPSFNALTLWDDRQWGVDAENPNQLWYSKTVVPTTPVEMSDLFTLYVPPTTSTGISTGPCKCLAPMDDKLIIFKKNAIYYINGTGPDSTGANSQYSKPTLITSTVGCSNQNSIVFMPNGLMFKSDKGIWLLGRDLSTQYIGAAVEGFNDFGVKSALAIPGTNEVRFTLNNGTTLMYDYFYNQWGEFRGIPGISSTLYQGLHSYINSYGQAFSETPDLYLDGGSPVLMSFKTGWLNLTGLQGYQRAYEMYLLGNYYTPHKLTVGVAYDYNPNITQLPQIYPNNFSQNWGVSSTWGVQGTVWGGPTQREQWQVNFERQQCQSFQISFNEYYDPRFGVVAGAGLELSGINLVFGQKKGFPGNIPAVQRVT